MKRLVTKFVALLMIGCFCLSFAVGCGSGNEKDPQILAIYNSYVVYAQAEGQTPLSYEEWLESIKGEKGDKGDKGDAGQDGKDGVDGEDGKDGEDGVTPTIEIKNGYWYINGVNTGVKAEGKDGADGQNGKDGVDGTNGKDGADCESITATINLFDKEKASIGKGLSTRGVEYDADAFSSDYISVVQGQNVAISGYVKRVIFYNLNKSFVQMDLNTIKYGFYTTIAPINGYVRVMFLNYKDREMIFYGNEMRDYVPFGQVIKEDIELSNSQKDWVGQSNVLYGKKWVACGDSFTEGDFSNSPTDDYFITEGKYKGEKKVYPFIIGNRNNMTIVNEAKCGTTLADISNVDVYGDKARKDGFSVVGGRYTQIPSDADYITLKFGINDRNKSVPIGTIDDATNTTFYGAWNIVLEYLLTNFPYAKIGVIVTNGTYMGYVTATIEACKKWGIPYLDEATGENIPLMLWSLRTDVCETAKTLRNNAFRVSESNSHPNAKAHEFESTIVEAWLRTL